MNEITAAISRVSGRAYPVRDIQEQQRRHGRMKAHIDAEWTTPEHWAHNNYERGHLPQLCVRASGWKAKIIAWILWPKAPWQPYTAPSQTNQTEPVAS